MKPTWLHALMRLDCGPIASSDKLAQEVGTSQQTASRWLFLLRKEGMIQKDRDYRITQNGATYLSQLKKNHPAALSGRVFSGVGEGKYYLSKPGYQDQFSGLLGFEPYPGTLNLRIKEPQSMQASRRLRQNPGLRLDGFKEKERTFGPARCYPCRIRANKKTANGAIIVPERTHYPEDVVELLSPVFLRKALGVKDKDALRLELI
ncbi:CTP-dependent riboflavin kinase [Candidatus Micrarchaeota archaeon]|nr:CTP-dependent riboflavin kinase [Candidatus Micrarchaeota archaeon]